MSQKNVQIQTQEQMLTQQQTLSSQQVLFVRLLEMPVDALAARIENECMENPWLEKKDPASEEDFSTQQHESQGMDYNPADDYRSEDDIPSYLLHTHDGERTMETVEYGETLTFFDHLQEQAAEYDLDEHQRTLLEYLIGSLDEDGLLRKPLLQIADELAIYQAVDTTEKELEEVLGVLWQFDPAGLGARSLQECLRLQILRQEESQQRKWMLQVVDHLWDEFTRNRWDHIAERIGLTASQKSVLQHEMLRLNPRPGAALNEAQGRNLEQVTPDFIVDCDEEGNLSFTLNDGSLPMLEVSKDVMGDDLAFTRRYVERGNLFIEALRQRRETMLKTMRTILKLQRDFFLEGDEALLHPMILEDVARVTGQDISTVSRVCNSKYVLTPYGTYPLRWFFSQKSVQRDGEALSGRQVQVALRQLIDSEDKAHPLSDERLTTLMQQQGFQIARRTIAKYREAMGIPTSRLRH